MTFVIRTLEASDAAQAIRLYAELVGPTVPVADETRYAEVLAHSGTHVIGLFEGRALLAMATLHLLPNMTFGGRAYALVENVVTHGERQGQGLGRQVMERVIDMAWAEGAYKIMLLTGRDLGARGFYEKLGFTGDEKHAMTLRRAPPRAPLPRGAPAH